MSDVHAEHAPEALMDPTDPWGTLGAHVVEAKGARGARVGGGVSVGEFLTWRFGMDGGRQTHEEKASMCSVVDY